MSADPISRRRMLGAGSALAVGVLLGTPRTLGATPALGTEQIRELLAILNRHNEVEGFAEHYDACDCRHCETVRAKPYLCGSCGFGGTPLVFPCECARQWDEFTQTNADMLRAVKGKAVGRDRGLPAAPAQRRKARALHARQDPVRAHWNMVPGLR